MASKADSSNIARRYATAFFDLALEKKKLDKVAGDLDVLLDMFQSSADLQGAMENPLFSRDAQAKALVAVGKKAGLSDLTLNFLGIIAENRRLALVVDIIKAVQARIAEHRGEVTAEITAASDLTKKQTDALQASLKKALGTDVKLDVKVVPEILGGLIVKVDSYMVDNSVKTKLDRLHRTMKSQDDVPEQEKMKEVA